MLNPVGEGFNQVTQLLLPGLLARDITNNSKTAAAVNGIAQDCILLLSMSHKKGCLLLMIFMKVNRELLIFSPVLFIRLAWLVFVGNTVCQPRNLGESVSTLSHRSLHVRILNEFYSSLT